MFIYIRHAEKKYKNGQNSIYKFDPEIKENQDTKFEKLTEKLINKYGIPDIILTSPYERTRQTAKEIKKYIKKYKNNDIKIKICVEVSEYLGNHSTSVLDVRPETKKSNPPHPEDLYLFRYRIRRHIKNMEKYKNNKVWIISHGLVISTVDRMVRDKRFYPDCLDYTVIKK